MNTPASPTKSLISMRTSMMLGVNISLPHPHPHHCPHRLFTILSLDLLSISCNLGGVGQLKMDYSANK